MVRLVGIEPTLQRNGILNPARLPIPPQPHRKVALYKTGLFKKPLLISSILYFFNSV